MQPLNLATAMMQHNTFLFQTSFYFCLMFHFKVLYNMVFALEKRPNRDKKKAGMHAYAFPPFIPSSASFNQTGK